jgi:hypothetical protein
MGGSMPTLLESARRFARAILIRILHREILSILVCSRTSNAIMRRRFRPVAERS